MRVKIDGAQDLDGQASHTAGGDGVKPAKTTVNSTPQVKNTNENSLKCTYRKAPKASKG